MLINDFINTVSNKVFGKDNGVKVNNTKVQQIVTDTSNIATSIVTSARDNVAAAIDELNKVAEKAGTVQVENINSLFNEIGSSIEAIGTKLQEKVKQVESYSKGSSSSSTVGETLLNMGTGIMDLFTPYGVIKKAGKALSNLDIDAKKVAEIIGKGVVITNPLYFPVSNLINTGKAISQDKNAQEFIKTMGTSFIDTMTPYGVIKNVGKVVSNLDIDAKEVARSLGVGALVLSNPVYGVIYNLKKTVDTIKGKASPKDAATGVGKEAIKKAEEAGVVPTPGVPKKDDDKKGKDENQSTGGGNNNSGGENNSSGGGNNNSGGGNNSYGGGGNSGTPNYTAPEPTPAPTEPPKTSTEKKEKDPINPVNPSDKETVIITPPSDNATTETTTTENTIPPSQTQVVEHTNEVYHTGGGYSEADGYTPVDEAQTENLPIETPEENTIEDTISETTTSIDEIIKGNKYTKIPTSTTPIKKAPSKGGGSAIIPIAAGLSAAAAAGIGAKAYIDRKNNSDNGDEEDFEDDWSENDSANLDYDDTTENEDSTYLTDDDAYAGEKYDARNNNELEDLQ